VRLCLRRVDHEADSGRGSPVGATPSLKRRKNRKSGGKHSGNHHEGLHPRRLAELGGFDRDAYQEYQLRRLSTDNEPDYYYGEKIYGSTQEATRVRKKREKGCPAAGMLHSTAIEEKTKKCCSKRSGKPKIRNSENIEKLMKLILAQGATIQSQLHKLKEREKQIETIEEDRHMERSEKNGRNYLLETYFESLKDAEVPATDEEKGNDSGVHTEAGSEQTTSGCDKSKLPTLAHKSLRNSLKMKQKPEVCQRQSRSRSETRSTDIEENKLVRTLSESTVPKCDSEQTTEPANADEEEFVELRRIQSQVEMWEKVLRINKKLEKEEENLVKLHIQIRRIQQENIKIAKDHNPDPASQTLQKQLENLRSDLDQNSKEIYNNFTKLIEEDDQVVEKQNHYRQLMSDLEETDVEHAELSQLMVRSQTPTPDLQAHFQPVLHHNPENMGLSLQVKGQEKVKECDLMPSAFCPSDNLPLTSQRLLQQPSKPKIIKISFDENVNSTELDPVSEKVQSPSPVPGRNIKGILKNRSPTVLQVQDLEKGPVNHGTNISSCETTTKLEKSTSFQGPSADGASTSFAAAMANPCDHLFPSPVNRREAIYQPGSPPKPSDGSERYIPVIFPATSLYEPNLQEARRVPSSNTVQPGSLAAAGQGVRQAPHSKVPPSYPSGLMVTTKAIVHDNDSSGSSDTSGLSSMYSGSPVADESPYVLNTLV